MSELSLTCFIRNHNNPHTGLNQQYFFIFDIRALWHQSARMSKIKNSRLDQYGAEPFEPQQFETVGVEGVNLNEQSAYKCDNDNQLLKG